MFYSERRVAAVPGQNSTRHPSRSGVEAVEIDELYTPAAARSCLSKLEAETGAAEQGEHPRTLITGPEHVGDLLKPGEMSKVYSLAPLDFPDRQHTALGIQCGYVDFMAGASGRIPDYSGKDPCGLPSERLRVSHVFGPASRV